MALWRTVGTAIHYDVLPDGLPDTDELAIVVLGFQLNPDGSMRSELTERLSEIGAELLVKTIEENVAKLLKEQEA